MDGMDDLVQFLRARLDEDALWATEASRRSGEPAVEGGVHWQWVDPETDEAIAPAPDRDEFVGGEDRFRVSLRSRETWPTSWASELPQFAIPTAEEVPSAVGGHIARHDPARVLAEVEAKRQIIVQHERYAAERRRMMGGWDPRSDDSPILAALAAVYADHPDYRDTWRP